MTYTRVLPRDLFNEAKLLKCMGRLSLLIEDELVRWPLTLEHRPFTHGSLFYRGFVVEQDSSDGSIFVTNLTLALGGTKIRVKSALNSKAPYPLVYEDERLGVGCVFNDDGSLAEEFAAYLDRLTEIARVAHDPVC